MIIQRRSLFGNDRGVIAPATALALAALLGMVGLVTDASIWYAQRRDLQGATDAAALGAARFAYDSTSARDRVVSILASNGIPEADLVSVETGYYCPIEDTTKQIFQATACDSYPTAPYKDAIRLQTKASGTIILSRLFTDEAITNRPITTTSTAALVNEAGLRAGTGLVELGKEGLAGKAITALTGGTVTLTAVHYTGLASTNIDGIRLLNQIASVKGSVGTYKELLNTDVTAGQLFQAAVTALNQQPNIATVDANALNALGLLANVSGMGSIRLGKLFDVGVWEDMKVTAPGAPTIPLRADINAYQLAMATLEVANGNHAVAIPNISIADPTGLITVQAKSTIIEPPVEPYFGFGPEGTSVHTAQVRLQIQAGINANAKGLLGALIPIQINLPLYVEAASGDARIDKIYCNYVSSDDTTVKVSARSSIANVYLGEASTSLMKDFSSPISLAQLSNAKIVNVSLLGIGLLSIEGKAAVTVGSANAPYETPPLTFVQSPGPASAKVGIIGKPATASTAAIAPVAATVGSTGNVGGLLNSLTTLPLLGPLVAILAAPLGPLVHVVDGLVDNLLQALGIRVGMMDVFVTGARCGVPVLVE
jgi:uncharacterized membrane protein